MPAYCELEQEVIVLKAVWGLIDELVNYAMFSKQTRTEEVCMMPLSAQHQRLFNILLTDLLSRPRAGHFDLPASPTNGTAVERTYLYYLRQITKDPRLNPDGADELEPPVSTFSSWLDADCRVERVWLPSVSIELDITLKRIEAIRICGNIAKHNFSRLDRDVREIRRILKRNGHDIDEGQGYLVIPEFYEWFHTNVLNYLISQIAKLLNDIRWGIYKYLRPHFLKSFTRGEPFPPAYSFKVPAECQSKLTEAMYWDLMNDVRSEPYMPQFTVDPYLLLRF